jgi:hypothetical protein
MKPYWCNRPDRIIGRGLLLVGVWTVFVCGYVVSLLWRRLGMKHEKEGK